MSFLLAVDPGLRGCGAAIFKDKALVRAAYVKNSQREGRGYKAHALMALAVSDWVWTVTHERLRMVVLEHPRIYPAAAQQKGDLNDLLDVCGVGAAIAATYQIVAVKTVFPSEWKGQVPKKIMNNRVLNALTAGEVGVSGLGSSKDHNTLDAIGIGLAHFGRINGKVVA